MDLAKLDHARKAINNYIDRIVTEGESNTKVDENLLKYAYETVYLMKLWDDDYGQSSPDTVFDWLQTAAHYLELAIASHLSTELIKEVEDQYKDTIEEHNTMMKEYWAKQAQKVKIEETK